MRALYIHVPFCLKKCPYCDFYSLTELSRREVYTSAVEKALEEWTERDKLTFDTLYFGGGTPSVLGGEAISRLVRAANRLCLAHGAEITVECNPSSVDEYLADRLASCGVNRVSLGMQSAVENERMALGRLSGADEVKKALNTFFFGGISNLSLDLMLGVPEQSVESLDNSLDFCIEAGVRHVSAYMLKLEEGTPFFSRRSSLRLASEDEVCDMYLHTVERLNSAGLTQYEISNFSQPGFESRNNCIYWNCEEYLGLGPSAHSFLGGRRFFYEKNLDSFLLGKPPVDDGIGGDYDEYAMLRLRLNDGLRNDQSRNRFGYAIPREFYNRAQKFSELGLLVADNKGIRLKPEGFLLSNTIIAEIIMN